MDGGDILLLYEIFCITLQTIYKYESNTFSFSNLNLQGDQVEVKGGKLYINGAKQDEPFTAEDAAYDFGPVTVPSGNVLVLGDNRNHSLDGASSFKLYFFHSFFLYMSSCY
jgi:hypothetical protein